MIRVQTNKKEMIQFKPNFCAILYFSFTLLIFSVSATGEESKQKLLKKTDAEILKSLDTLKNQINNDIFLIEKINDMKANDNFDNINIDALFNNMKLNDIKKNNNNEEKTINKLDKSNLINLEDGEDAWWSDVIEDVEIEDVD